jgi:hypothetical protein
MKILSKKDTELLNELKKIKDTIVVNGLKLKKEILILIEKIGKKDKIM